MQWHVKEKVVKKVEAKKSKAALIKNQKKKNRKE